MSGSYLTVRNEDPVELTGIIDSAGNLQIVHGSDSLADFNQILLAVHEDLPSPNTAVRIKLNDFTVGATTWQLSASHDDGGGTESWSTGSGHVYYDFGEMTILLDVDVEATSNASPPQNKSRTVKVKVKSTDGLPDPWHR